MLSFLYKEEVNYIFEMYSTGIEPVTINLEG